VSMPRSRLLLVAIPVLWIAVLASAAGTIWAKHRARELFVELERLNVRRDTLEIEWGQLQLEQSAWSTHAFVERVASTKLRMAMPAPAEIQIVIPAVPRP
jgi:cell division protein FtsL